MRTNEQLELVVKSFANQRRISILKLIKSKPKLSLIDIAEELNLNLKTASEHVRKMYIAGIVSKKKEGNFIFHTLTPRGKSILEFLRILG